jgi:hypothetical protein
MKGRAKLGTDFILSGPSLQVTIPAGQASATVTLHSLEDNGPKEHVEELTTMVLQKGAGYRLSFTKRATLQINDD